MSKTRTEDYDRYRTKAGDEYPESGQFPRRDDVSCEKLPEFKAKWNQDWGLQDSEKGNDDLGSNKLNRPVPERQGDAEDNGWEWEDIRQQKHKSTDKRG